MSRREGPPFHNKPAPQEIEGEFKVVEESNVESAEKIKAEAEAAWMKDKAEELYFGLTGEVKESGLQMVEIKEIANEAYQTYSRMAKIAKTYGESNSEQERKQLLGKFNTYSELLAGDISEKVGERVSKVLKARETSHEASVEAPAVEEEQISEATSQEEVPVVTVAAEQNNEPFMANSPALRNVAGTKQKKAATPPAARPVPHSFDSLGDITKSESEPEEDKPIVMLNTILSKQAGLKPKKAPKARKERKSVSEGGTVYKGKVFDSIFDEPISASAPEVQETETIIARRTPETLAEHKAALRRSIEEINKDIAIKRKAIEALEKSDKYGIKETERFQARNGGTPVSVDEAIRLTEKELHDLENEKITANAKPEVISVTAEAPEINANDNASKSVPTEAAAQQQIAEPAGSNIINLAAEREARIKAKEVKNKQSFWKRTRGALAALGLITAAAPETLAAAEHAPKPAVASAEKAPTGVSVSIEKNGEGADALFKELQKKLKEKHPAGARIPDTVTKKIMETNPHELSTALHFIRDKGKESAWMHPGDSLEVNARGQLVFHEHAKGADHSQTLMESGIASARVVNFFTGHYQAAHAEHQKNHVAPHTETTPHAASVTHETNPEILNIYAKELAGSTTTIERHAPVKVPAAAERAPAVAESAHAAEQAAPDAAPHAPEVTNSHGVHIDKTTAHMYEDARGALIVYGGSSEQQLKMINDFFEERSNQGKTVLAVTSKIDPLTGKPDLSSFSVDEEGKTKLIPVLTDEDNAIILPPTEDELVKKVQ